MSTSRVLLLAAALLAGCSYEYRNPAEALRAGEIGGRTINADQLVLDGVAVSVKGSPLDARSRASGRFAVLPLPTGRHTLVLRKGSSRALQREVDIAPASDGQPQSIWLGDVEVPAAVAIAGECMLPGGAPIAAGGIVVDEASGETATLAGGVTGRYVLSGLAVGSHRIRVFALDLAGTPFVAGPVDVTFAPSDAGTQKTLARLTLRAPRAALVPVRLRVSVSGRIPGLALSDLAVTGLGQPVAVGRDGLVEVAVPEGPWTVSVQVPASAEGAIPPRPLSFVAVAGAPIDLGTLYVASAAAREQAEGACHADADCAPGTCGPDGLCRGYVAPPAAPASVPFCDRTTLGCEVGATIGLVSRVTTTCVSAGASSVGVTCGACCTPDAITVLCADDGTRGCRPPTLATISGTIGGDARADVSVSLVGEGVDRVTFSAFDGQFAFSGIPDGTYQVAAFADGFDFTPPTATVVVAGGVDVTSVDFVAAAWRTTFTVAGSVSAAPQPELPVWVYIIDSSLPHYVGTTVAAGTYRVDGVPPGRYGVSPQLPPGYTATPPEQNVLVVDADVFDVNFVVSWSGFSVAGAVVGQLPAGGLQVLLTSAAAPTDPPLVASTDTWGGYQFIHLDPGTYSVSAAPVPGYAFAPSVAVVVENANVWAPDLTSTWVGFVVTGAVSGLLPPGVPVVLSSLDLPADPALVATTSGTGAYAFSHLNPGRYAVTAGPLPGYTFSTVEVVVTAADVAAPDVVATWVGFAVSGAVSAASPASPAGLRMLLSSSAAPLDPPLVATTGASGAYQFSGLSPGSYTVTPAPVPGYSFAPAAVPVTVVAVDVAVTDVVATWTGFSVTGSVSGLVQAGLRVVLSSVDVPTDPPLLTTTSDTGAYAFTHLNPGRYAVTAGPVPGYTFSTVEVVVAAADVAAPDVVATWVGFAVSGTARTAGVGRAGVEVRLLSPPLVTTTDAAGGYRFAGLNPGSYTVVAQSPGNYVTPAQRVAQVTAADVGGQDFSVVPPLQIAGALAGGPTAGVLVTLQGPAQAITVTDGSGAYAFPNLVPGTYTVTPSVTGTTVDPMQRVVTLTEGDALTEDFTTAAGVQSWVCATWCWDAPGPFGAPAIVDVAVTPDTGDVWVASARELIRFDGWFWIQQFSSASNLHALWSAGSEAWAVGDAETYHWDGVNWGWTRVEAPVAGGVSLFDVWGASTTDVWAVGSGGTIMHSNGISWQPWYGGPATANLYAVAGSGPGDVWAVGEEGVFHFDGTSWTAPAGRVTSRLTAVYAGASNDAWAVGAALHHWDGTSWTTVTDPAVSGTPTGVWGTSFNDVWVGMAGTIANWNADTSRWTAYPSPSGSHPLTRFAGATTEAWGVADGLVVRWNGTAWGPYSHGPRSDVTAVWAPGNGDTFLFRWDSALGWGTYDLTQGGTSSSGLLGAGVFVRGAWGSATTDVWTVGSAGTILHYDGVAWIPTTSGTSVVLNGVAGTAANDVWAVGDQGTILHWDGTGAWSAIASGTTGALTGVWAAAANDAWAVGVDPADGQSLVLHWDGTSWSPWAGAPRTNPLAGVWGLSATNVVAAGSPGDGTESMAMHWDGASWTTITTGSTATLHAVGDCQGSLYVVGSGGTALIWNGTGFTPSATPLPPDIALTGVGWGILVGERGTMLSMRAL